uniref:Uncharacterized protein n=1 Tax=Arundo donax TaxID=35708 RepID=A0A0A8ZYK9_ARUDO
MNQFLLVLRRVSTCTYCQCIQLQV